MFHQIRWMGLILSSPASSMASNEINSKPSSYQRVDLAKQPLAARQTT